MHKNAQMRVGINLSKVNIRVCVVDKKKDCFNIKVFYTKNYFSTLEKVHI